MSKRISKVPSNEIIPGGTFDQYDRTLAQYNFWASYRDALHNYLTAIGHPLSSIPLYFSIPHLFFYTRKRKKELFFLYAFPFAGKKTFRITARTFPAFLRFLKLSKGPAHLRLRLLEELEKVVRQYPYKERELLCKKALQIDNDSTVYLESKLLVSPAGNLYFPSFLNENSENIALFPYTTVVSSCFKRPASFSGAFMKQYLGAFIRNPQNNAITPSALPDDCVVFFDGTANTSGRFRILAPDSAPRFNEIDAPMLPTKVLTFDNPPSIIPNRAASWLFHLTGGNSDLLKQLATLLARAASSTCSKRMAVIYSSQNAGPLLDFIAAILAPLISTAMRNNIHPLKSINSYCRASGLKSLFISQETGAGVVFVNDTAISDIARPILKKLISGQPIPISVPGLPKQWLYNRNHIICISSNLEKATRLSKELKTPLLDFSKHELPVCLSIDSLSDEDLLWLRCAFLPYGLLDLPYKTAVNKSSTITWVEEFLDECCNPQPGALRYQKDFYSDYCACYTAKFPGKQPPLTVGRFAKAVNSLLGKGTYRNASYHKNRKDQKMYFYGIICTRNPADILPVPQKTALGKFDIQLKIIHRFCPYWIPNHDSTTTCLADSHRLI